MKLVLAPRGQARKVLVYGPPKVGKTQLVSELAATFNLLWFDLESGHATLFKLPVEHQERVELVVLPDSRVYPIGIETCLKVIRGTPGWIDNETGKWVVKETDKKADKEYTFVHLNSLDASWIVVFDSLTQLTNSAISHITKNQPDDYKMNFDDWGNLGKSMDMFLSQVQAAKYNVVCISHETETEMEDGKVKIVPVAGSRAFSRNTAKYFSDVVYCEVKNRKHVFTSSTTGTLNVITGSRTDVATEKMDKPSLIPIFEQVSKAPVNQSNGQKAVAQLAAVKAAPPVATVSAGSEAGDRIKALLNKQPTSPSKGV